MATKTEKLPTKLVNLAARCGIDARDLTREQLVAAYKLQLAERGPYVDQHDMTLQEALKLN